MWNSCDTLDTFENSHQAFIFSVMKVKVIPPGKPPRPTEVIAEGEKNLKWIVKEGMTSTSCDPKSN